MTERSYSNGRSFFLWKNQPPPLHYQIADKVFSALNANELEELGRLLKKLGKAAT